LEQDHVAKHVGIEDWIVVIEGTGKNWHCVNGSTTEFKAVLVRHSRKLAFFADPFGNLIELAEVLA